MTLSRKVLSKLMQSCDSISYGVEFSRMQEDNNGNRIAGMLAVTYKSRLWVISMWLLLM